MKGSKVLVQMLKKAGVQVVFGLCGDTSLPLYDEFMAEREGLTHVLTRDERCASFMADVYARLSGRVGVCEGPSGGGVTYIAPGLIEANLSSVPLIAITTDIDARTRGKGTLTEMDQDAFFAPLTTWTNTPAHGEELPDAIRNAFLMAIAGSLGSTHLGLPYNVQEAEVSEEETYIDPKWSQYPVHRTAPDTEAVKTLARELAESKNPVIVAGAGVIRSEAWDELKALCELLGCPVATSISGKGALAETHPLCLGVIGSNGGLPYRHQVVQEADLVFFVGCRVGSVTTEKWSMPAKDKARVVQLDVSPQTIGLNYPVAAGVVADAKLGLAALVEELNGLLSGSPRPAYDPARIPAMHQAYLQSRPEFQSDEAPIRPERFVSELARLLPENAIVITDPGTATPYMAAYWQLPQAGRWFVAPRAHGALGYAIPGVVGAHFARPQDKVIGITGDGSFGISVGELETIARLNLPVLIIVLANACYGWVKAGQKVRGERYFGVDFSSTDHVRVAEAYGLKAWKVEAPSDLAAVLEQALACDGPALVEVISQPLHEAKAPVSKWVA